MRQIMFKKAILDALTKRYNAQISEAETTIKIYLEKPVGIGEHGDILTEIEKELKIVAEYDDQLQMIDKYFTKKDPFKS